MTTNLTINHEDQERVRGLLTEAVTVLCKNGLKFSSHVTIDGLLGVTVDSADVFLIKISETVSKHQENSDFSQVAQLLGAAKANYGLSISNVCTSGSPVPMTTYSLQGEKDHNDNHAPPVINITPTSGRSLLSPQTVQAKRRMMDKNSPYEPQGKRPHLSATTNEGWELTRDNNPDALVIKSEPIDSDEEVSRYAAMKTIGVISTVQPEPTSDSDDASSNNALSDHQSGEPQDGVLAALRAALIHKLANGGTPATPKQNNNNNNNTPKVTSSSKKARTTATSAAAAATPKETPETEQTLKCLMCTYETKRRYNFIRHMRGHSKSYAIYACDLCGERFHSEMELGAHGLEAHKGHHLTCDQCGMTFMSERGKNIHGKTHKMMPIPDKKTVECETQCTDQEVEETMARHRGIEAKDDNKPYSALRSQLSASSMVLYYPVLNGKPGGISTEGLSTTEAEILNESSKSTGTGTETDIPSKTSASETTSANAEKDPKPTEDPSSSAQQATSETSDDSEDEAIPAKAKETSSKTSTSSTSSTSSKSPSKSDETPMDFTIKKSTTKEGGVLSSGRSRSSATPPPKSIESVIEAATKKGKAKEVLASTSATSSSASALPTASTKSPTAASGTPKTVKIITMRPGASPVPESRKEKSRKQDSTLITRVIPMVPVKAEPDEAS